jgi:hypothetical protein
MLTDLENFIPIKYKDNLRHIQQQYFKFIVENWKKYDVFVFNAPVGSGKSLCATTTAKWRTSLGERTAIITPKVMLQDQYTQEFKEITSLKGRARYHCAEYGDCDTGYNICESYCMECPYKGDRDAIEEASIGIFNFYSYVFGSYEANTLIIDEAHNAFDSVSDIYTKYIYKCEDDYGEVNTIGDALIFLESKNNKLVDRRNKLRTISGYNKEFADLNKEIRALQQVIRGVQNSPKDFYFEKIETVYRGIRTEALRLQPITLQNLGNILFQNVGKIILMSGTINNIDIRKLGLSAKRVGYIEEPSPIPAERRPIIFKPVANMAYKYQDISIPLIAKDILTIAKDQKGKGVIHTTYDIASKLRPYLDDDARFIFHSNKDKDAVYKTFRSSEEPLILVASGMSEGIDLPYDAGRWQVITKIQYPSLADNLMAYYKDKEKDHYAWLTIRTLVQQCGRICRGPDDYGITYILDTCFENLYKFNRNLFPKYFSDSVIQKPRK